MAAGVFQHISENLTSHFNVPTPADVSPISLNFLLKWSLAAAQECFVLKGIAEKTIKDGMLAKLASATGQMYESAKDLGEELGIGSIFGKSMSAYLLGRATYYKALAQVKKSAEALAANRYGEEISRLNEATNLLTRCKEHKRLMDSSTLNLLDTLAGQIVKNLERAIKDNSIIYHETIPAVTGLPDIGQAIVARATVMPDWSKDPSVPSRPILSRLVPETIRVRSIEYYEKRNAQVAELFSRLRGLKQVEQEIMKECNLPSLLDASQTSMGLPESILEKSQYVRSNGGAESLQSSLTTVDALKSDAKQLLKQVEDLLTEELANDSQARQEFGSKWTRPESEKLTKTLQAALDSYKKSFLEAGQSDLRIQSEFDDCIVGITSLDSSQSELEESIPSSTTNNSQRGDVNLARNLRVKLEIVNGFEGRRISLIQRIEKYYEGDAVEEAFTALGEEALRDDDYARSVISNRLNCEEFIRFLAETDAIECEQQIQLSELKQMAISFAASLTLSSALEERQNALQTLETAFISFKNLSTQLQNAVSFYSDLLDLLQKLRENTRDFTVSRGIELEELKGSIKAAMMVESMRQTGSANTSYRSPQNVYSPTNRGAYNPNAYPAAAVAANNINMGNNNNNFNYDDNYVNYNEDYNVSVNEMSYANVYPGAASQIGSGQNYMMPPLRRNAAGSTYSMPHPSQQQQQQQQWQPGMPVQYAGNSGAVGFNIPNNNNINFDMYGNPIQRRPGQPFNNPNNPNNNQNFPNNPNNNQNYSNNANYYNNGNNYNPYS